MSLLKVVARAFLLLSLMAALPSLAVRRPDVSSSSNGIGPSTTCPNSTATPFFAQLDGTQTPPAGCDSTNGDPNKPNPPATYPDLSVTLSGAGFTVTVTPALWDRGNGTISNAPSKYTIFQVVFTGQPGMTLQSLVIKSELNGAAYIPCDPNFPGAIPYCMSSPILGPGNIALEPTAIDEADANTTRWDFSQFTSGSLSLAVIGFPSEFSKIDRYPNSNKLTAATFTSANFLATVVDSSNNILTAGGETLKTAPAATNDLFANAIKITKLPFKSFVNTSATGPSEILSGTGAGDQENPQGDPIPQDPDPANAGTPCNQSWPSGSVRVFRSVWYSFTPATSENYEIKTASSRYDTGVYVFTGSPAAPTPVACNDDAPLSNTGIGLESSFVNFGATAGVTYYVMVSEVPPPVGVDENDNPLAAPLADDATLEFNLGVGSSVVMQPNTVLNFPSTPVKTTTSLPITVTNTTSQSVTISRFAFSSSGAQDFSQTSNCIGSLGPGAPCTVTVTFDPRVAGSHTAYLQLFVTGGVSPTQIQVNGTGF